MVQCKAGPRPETFTWSYDDGWLLTDEPRMSEEGNLDDWVDAGEPLPSQKPPRATPARFAPILDILAGVILLTGIGTITLLSWSLPPLDRIPHADRALAIVVSKSMDLEEALEDVPDWERLLFEAVSGETGGMDDVIEWYRELADHLRDPAVTLKLGILEGEAGEVQDLEAHLGRWATNTDPLPLYARLLEAAYLSDGVSREEEFRLQAELAEVLSAGWFYDRVAIRLAEQADHHELLSATRAAADRRQEELLTRARGFLLAELLLIGAGGTVLVLGFLPGRRDPSALRIAEAAIPPRWGGRAGLLVLLRGGAAGVLVIIGFILVGVGEGPFRLLMVPLIVFPLLWLAYHHLLRPHGLGFADGLGLRPAPRRWSRVVLTVMVLSAAGLVVDWVIMLIAGPLGLSLHWTDWFDPELVWGSGVQMGLTLVDYLVFAPVFEEVVFRGILFGTLRRRFSFLPAALLSAVVFALAHGYGLFGLVSVCASGVIWAWGYEQTRSLVPVVIAHFLNNLLVCSGLMLMLR